jgi:hypothetical protein
LDEGPERHEQRPDPRHGPHYLGAGKTTLLNRIIAERRRKRYAVIINEYGEVGIDNDLVVDADEEVFEMNNGCICSSVRSDGYPHRSSDQHLQPRGQSPGSCDALRRFLTRSGHSCGHFTASLGQQTATVPRQSFTSMAAAGGPHAKASRRQ